MVERIPDPTAEKQPLLKRQEFGCTIKQQPRVEDRTNGMEWCGRLQHLKRRPSEAVLLMWRAPCQVVRDRLHFGYIGDSVVAYLSSILSS